MPDRKPYGAHLAVLQALHWRRARKSTVVVGAKRSERGLLSAGETIAATLLIKERFSAKSGSGQVSTGARIPARLLLAHSLNPRSWEIISMS